MVIISNGTVVNQSKRIVTIDGKIYDFPKGMRGQNVTVIDNKVYIDGLELVNGEWKGTLKALWHKFF